MRNKEMTFFLFENIKKILYNIYIKYKRIDTYGME